MVINSVKYKASLLSGLQLQVGLHSIEESVCWLTQFTPVQDISLIWAERHGRSFGCLHGVTRSLVAVGSEARNAIALRSVDISFEQRISLAVSCVDGLLVDFSVSIDHLPL